MEQDEFTAEGGCACEAVRYRITARPLFVHCCHCRRCQRETGAAFALNALIETDRIEVLEGEPATVQTPCKNGKPQKIVRCPACRLALWSHYPAGGDKIAFIRVGALDDPDLMPPDIHIYTATKQPWVVLSDKATIVADDYAIKDFWPEASLRRVGAMT